MAIWRQKRTKVFPRETILSQSEQAFVRFCRQMAIRRNL